MSGGGARTVKAADDELPPALRSMWRVMRLGLAAERRLMLASLGLALLAALPDALVALWLRLLVGGVERRDRPALVTAALGLAACAAATWVLRTVGSRVQRRFRDRVSVALEGHVAGLQARIPTIEHQERPEHLDRLAVLRDQVFVLDHLYMSAFGLAGWGLRLVVTAVLLASVHPALLLLAVGALPPVLTAAWRPGIERAAFERGAAHDRLARHLFTVATTAGPGKEVRTLRIGARLAADRRASWDRWYGPVGRARWASAWWHAAAWAAFGATFVGAVAWVAVALDRPAAQVVLVLAAGARLSAYVGATVGEVGFLRGIWLDGSRRLVWLEDLAAAATAAEDLDAPAAVHDGIVLDHVSFAYPGTGRLVLDDVSLRLPAGAVVAVVGENGAGKSTLVKLLAKLYAPTSGTISVDGTPLHRIRTESWRQRLAGSFQDFVRFELRAGHAVGVGDLPHVDDEPAIVGAVGRAGADDVVERLPTGLDAQLGPAWPGGVDLSFGQWQKLAVARGFMREAPLLLVLDEPTAALDAETEHALFERYAAGARGPGRRGGVTVLVSHRFSTVRMADLIVVLDGARAVEVGTHEELVARGGTYAELYAIQAAAYRS